MVFTRLSKLPMVPFQAFLRLLKGRKAGSVRFFDHKIPPQKQDSSTKEFPKYRSFHSLESGFEKIEAQGLHPRF